MLLAKVFCIHDTKLFILNFIIILLQNADRIVKKKRHFWIIQFFCRKINQMSYKMSEVMRTFFTNGFQFGCYKNFAKSCENVFWKVHKSNKWLWKVVKNNYDVSY